MFHSLAVCLLAAVLWSASAAAAEAGKFDFSTCAITNPVGTPDDPGAWVTDPVGGLRWVGNTCKIDHFDRVDGDAAILLDISCKNECSPSEVILTYNCSDGKRDLGVVRWGDNYPSPTSEGEEESEPEEGSKPLCPADRADEWDPAGFGFKYAKDENGLGAQGAREELEKAMVKAAQALVEKSMGDCMPSAMRKGSDTKFINPEDWSIEWHQKIEKCADEQLAEPTIAGGVGSVRDGFASGSAENRLLVFSDRVVTTVENGQVELSGNSWSGTRLIGGAVSSIRYFRDLPAARRSPAVTSSGAPIFRQGLITIMREKLQVGRRDPALSSPERDQVIARALQNIMFNDVGKRRRNDKDRPSCSTEIAGAAEIVVSVVEAQTDASGSQYEVRRDFRLSCSIDLKAGDTFGAADLGSFEFTPIGPAKEYLLGFANLEAPRGDCPKSPTPLDRVGRQLSLVLNASAAKR